jgi:gluconolactonase
MSTLETLASGYSLIEGPRVDSDQNLYFSDVHNGGVYRRSPDGAIETVVPKRRGVGGIALHADGGLVISGRNICHVRDGETRVLFAPDDVGGFNDLFTDGAGRVYAGSLRSSPFGDDAGKEKGDLWRIDAPGQATRLYGDVALSNGIGFSPDGTRLYHSDSVPQQILLHDVTPDGNVKGRRALATLDDGVPDGLAVDEEGCVWVAVYGGSCVARYTPDGVRERTIDVPAKSVTSLCFGGADLRDLYIVSADNSDDREKGGTIFRTRVDVPGLAAPLARI